MDVSLEEIINGRRASSGDKHHNSGDNRATRAYRGSAFWSNKCGGQVGNAGARNRRPNRFNPYAKGDMNASASGRGMPWNVQRVKQTSNALPDKTVKIHLSNVNFRVTTENIQEMFYELGPLKSVDFHYNQFGRLLGTATVRFENPKFKSTQEWYNVPLNGRHMKIKLSDLPNAVNYNLCIDRPATMSGGNTRGGGIQRNRDNVRGYRGNNNRGKFRRSGRDAMQFKNRSANQRAIIRAT